jgi:hypothetical protein
LPKPVIQSDLTTLQQAIARDISLQREVQKLAQRQRRRKEADPDCSRRRKLRNGVPAKNKSSPIEQWCDAAVQNAQYQSPDARSDHPDYSLDHGRTAGADSRCAVVWQIGGACAARHDRRVGAVSLVADQRRPGRPTEMAQMGLKLAQHTTEQAAALEETSAALEELSSMARRNAESADRVNQVAQQARAAADPRPAATCNA